MVPGAATRLEGTIAVSCVALMKAVVRFVNAGPPLHCTTEPAVKFVPLTVMVNAEEPATIDDGLMPFVEAIVGSGVAVMVKITADEIAPVPLETLTKALPAVVMRLAGTSACKCVVSTKIVCSGCKVPAFHCTTELLVNPEPFTTNAKPGPPATVLLGVNAPAEVNAGTG